MYSNLLQVSSLEHKAEKSYSVSAEARGPQNLLPESPAK